MPKARKANIAICYDFDGTLIRGNMQENSFLPDIGVSAEEFWNLVKKQARDQDMDEVLAYMQLMIDKARDARKRLTRNELTEHGRNVELFTGVEHWFASINDYCSEMGATVEHFVISSGLREMIQGSPIANEFLITYEDHVRTCALARDPIQAASMASCHSFGQCWATVTRSRRGKTLG